MRVILMALILMATFGRISIALSAEDKVLEDLNLNLPTAEELGKLSDKNLAEYLTGIQNLLTELSEQSEFESKYAVREQKKIFADFAMLKKAFAAATRANCIYAGHLYIRASNGLCPRPPQGSCASASLIMCNPVVYGPNVCVSPGRKATSSCESNARQPAVVANYIRSNPQAQGEWNRIKNDIQGYCRVGNQASICALIAARVGQIARLPGLSNSVQAPASYSPIVRQPVRANSGYTPTASSAPSGSRVLSSNSNGGSVGKCYSEVLVNGFRCNGDRQLRQVIDSETAYRAFCQGDQNFLKENKSRILSEARSVSRCVNAATASGTGYASSRVREQKTLVNSTVKTLNDCIQHIERGQKLPSRRVGQLRVTNQQVYFSIPSGQTAVAHHSMLAASVNLYGLRFCDFNLVVPGTSAPATTTTPQGNQ